MSRTIEAISKSKGASSGSEPDSTASQTMKDNAFRKKSIAVTAAGRKLLFLLCVGLTVMLFHPPLASAQVPDGTIELSGGKIAAGIGYSWGSGTLIFPRKPLPADGQRYQPGECRRQRIYRVRNCNRSEEPTGH